MTHKNPKIDSEEKTRKSILHSAMRFYGPEGARQVALHFDKYDKILKACGNESERAHIKKLAIMELHQMMQFKDGLSINGVDLLDPIELTNK